MKHTIYSYSKNKECLSLSFLAKLQSNVKLYEIYKPKYVMIISVIYSKVSYLVKFFERIKNRNIFVYFVKTTREL